MKRLLCALALVAFAAAPALADPKSDLISAMMQFQKVSSFHVSATDYGKTIELDMALPGKMHATMGGMEAIKIDNTTWVKMGGSWHQYAIPMLDSMTGFVTHAVDVATGKSSPDDMLVTDLGTKSPDGSPLHAYMVTSKSGKDATTLYVDNTSKLVRVDAPDGAIVRFSKFNAIDPIVPPM
jgi:hypothetical protein